MSTDSRSDVSPDGVVAVILDYSRPDLTVKCLLELRRQSQIPVIVVENGVSNADVYVGFGRVQVITNPRNLGFAGGMNVGIRAGTALECSRILLLNNDAWLMPDAVDGLVKALDSDSRLGMVGPVEVRQATDAQRRRGSAAYAAIGKIRAIGSLGSEHPHPGSPVVGYRRRLTGHCLLIRRELFRVVGLFDEDFFFIKEDDEFCDRALRGGFRLGLARRAWVVHPGSQSTSYSECKSVNFVIFNLSRGNILLARKTATPLLVAILAASYEAFRVWAKALLMYRQLCLDSLAQLVRGLLNGAKAALNPPPRL